MLSSTCSLKALLYLELCGEDKRMRLESNRDPTVAASSAKASTSPSAVLALLEQLVTSGEYMVGDNPQLDCHLRTLSTLV